MKSNSFFGWGRWKYFQFYILWHLWEVQIFPKLQKAIWPKWLGPVNLFSPSQLHFLAFLSHVLRSQFLQSLFNSEYDIKWCIVFWKAPSYYVEFYLGFRTLEIEWACRKYPVLMHLGSWRHDLVQRFILARSLLLHVISAFANQFFVVIVVLQGSKEQLITDTSQMKSSKLILKVDRRLCPLKSPLSLGLPLSFLPQLCLFSVPFFFPCLLVLMSHCF